MGAVKLAAAAAVGVAGYLAFLKLKKLLLAPKNVTLTYFNIEGAAEKVRLALLLSGTKFEDKRISFGEWPELKKTLKSGQLPLLTIDGVEAAQSSAMLRWAGSLGDGSLYPADPMQRLKVDEMIGVQEDLQRAWTPSLYMGMGRHTAYGHPENFEGKEATVKALREKFITDELPRFMKYIADAIAASGGPYLCGSTVTIADLAMLPQVHARTVAALGGRVKVRYFGKGVADHVPKETLDPYPEVKAWIEKLLAIPAVKEYYASK